MVTPTMRDVHIDRPLSNVVVSYKNPDGIYISDQVFPQVPVSKQSDKYYIWDKDVWFRNNVEVRTPGGEYPEARLKLSQDEYFCTIYNLAYPIAEEDVANQDEMIDLEVTGAEWLADQFMLNREINFASTYMKAGVWSNQVTGVSGNPNANQFRQWDDYANSNPILDFIPARQTIRRASGLRPSHLLISEPVMDVLMEHPDLIDKYKYHSTPILDQAQVQATLRIPNIIVAGAIVNQAEDGANPAFDGEYIFGDAGLFFYRPAAPGRRVASSGYTFVWNNVGGSGLSTPIRRYNDEARSRMLLQGRQAFGRKVVGAELGYYMGDTLGGRITGA